MAMLTLRDQNRQTARKKGIVAAAVAGGAVTLGVLTASPLLAALTLVPAAWLGWDWLQFRVKNGVRF